MKQLKKAFLHFQTKIDNDCRGNVKLLKGHKNSNNVTPGT